MARFTDSASNKYHKNIARCKNNCVNVVSSDILMRIRGNVTT
jgi:hypothetical protein